MNNKINGINTKITPTIAIRSQAFFIRSHIGNDHYIRSRKIRISPEFIRIPQGYAKGYDLTLSDTIKLHIDIYKLGNAINVNHKANRNKPGTEFLPAITPPRFCFYNKLK